MTDVNSGKPKVSVFVDWYSFTIESASDGKTDMANEENAHRLRWWVENNVGENSGLMYALMSPEWEYTTGRRPYSGGYSHPHYGIRIWFGGQSTILVEVSGEGCQQMRDAAGMSPAYDEMYRIIVATHDRSTRIDFAVDMETQTSPSEFVCAGYNPRIKTTGDLRSGTGETYYVGSRKSKSRYARVYRWTSPAYEHRAHLLRCEMVAQKKYAKQHARLVKEYGVYYAAQAMSNYFQWGHSDMPELEHHDETVTAPARKTSDANRLAWVKFQVAPAIRDLMTRKVITIEELIEMFEVSEYQEELFPEEKWE